MRLLTLVWKGLIISTAKIFPQVRVSLQKINENIDTLVRWYKKKNLRITAVTKGVCGSLQIARLFSNHDIHSIGDSHIQNIKKMKDAGIKAKFMLLRAPMQHEIEDVIAYTDFGLHSEITTIHRINKIAKSFNKIYNIVLMIELGDRREGILPKNIDKYVNQILQCKNIHLIGIGTNLVCLNGIKPTRKKMDILSDLAKYVQNKYAIKLMIISGGNSANFQWFQKSDSTGLINHLRIGEAILLGTDPISKSKIKGLNENAFRLTVEVIESKLKNSLPDGIPTFTAFGDKPEIKDEGEMNRGILAIGQQDLDIKGCLPIDKTIKIIGATSDHMVVASKNRILNVGDTVCFNLTYRALLKLMISPYVMKKYT